MGFSRVGRREIKATQLAYARSTGGPKKLRTGPNDSGKRLKKKEKAPEEEGRRIVQGGGGIKRQINQFRGVHTKSDPGREGSTHPRKKQHEVVPIKQNRTPGTRRDCLKGPVPRGFEKRKSPGAARGCTGRKQSFPRRKTRRLKKKKIVRARVERRECS